MQYSTVELHSVSKIVLRRLLRVSDVRFVLFVSLGATISLSAVIFGEKITHILDLYIQCRQRVPLDFCW